MHTTPHWCGDDDAGDDAGDGDDDHIHEDEKDYHDDWYNATFWMSEVTILELACTYVGFS